MNFSSTTCNVRNDHYLITGHVKSIFYLLETESFNVWYSVRLTVLT